ncbi:hypothetical protein NDU88_001843 [Pleurodeles waltl]|uniref:Uncharacterized protein n=1 Tax=Pleurodeles waltl TaxID=8319 RepID=A0AAV7PCD0_PLEWA|nr:hypothetical protein NDU88_001843 [Pleurodeles waltl]
MGGVSYKAQWLNKGYVSLHTTVSLWLFGIRYTGDEGGRALTHTRPASHRGHLLFTLCYGLPPIGSPLAQRGALSLGNLCRTHDTLAALSKEKILTYRLAFTLQLLRVLRAASYRLHHRPASLPAHDPTPGQPAVAGLRADDERKHPLLLHLIGADIHKITKMINKAMHHTYTTQKKAITAHIEPYANPDYERFLLRQARQKPGESVDDFYTRLRELASTCTLPDEGDEIRE